MKFVFATREIRKVPVTELSRCQRFDLRRIEAAELMQLLATTCAKEGVKAEPEALRQIARAAEGSARDALSILDQAIAHGGGKVEAATVQDMLGLADRARIVDLFEHVMRGDAAAALAEIAAQHETGADPMIVLTDLAEFSHYVTRLKLAPNAAAQAANSETERARGADFAKTLSLRALSRAWQMLVKGIQEVSEAPRPLAAAEMVLVRLCHAADLPTPDEALRMLREDAAPAPAPPTSSPPPPRTAPAGTSSRGMGGVQARRAEIEPVPLAVAESGPRLHRFEDLVEQARLRRDLSLLRALERQVRPVRFEPGRIEIALTADAASDLPQRLGQVLRDWTGERWLVAVTKEGGGQTVHETRATSRAAMLEEVEADPLVRKVLDRFPGAEIVAVRERGSAPDDAAPDDIGEDAPAPDNDED